MNKLYILFTLIYLPFQLYAQNSPQDNNIEQVQQTFMEFQSSVISEDEDWPKKFIDSSSTEFYTHLLTLIKEADSTQLMEESHAVILSVIYARHITPKGKFSSINNPFDLIYEMNQNHFTLKLSGIEIKDIKINNDSAIVYTAFPEKLDYTPFYFIFEDKEWKLNILTDYVNLEDVLANPRVQQKYGSTKSDVVNKIIHVNGWNTNKEKIWLPQP